MAQDSNLTPADFYDSEAEYRDELATVAKRHKWKVGVEAPLHIGTTVWGRADLVFHWKTKNHKGGWLPILVECKRRIKSASELRRAIEQVYAYRKIFGVAMDAVVTAPSIDTERPTAEVLDLFNVLVLDALELTDVLVNPPSGNGLPGQPRSILDHLHRKFRDEPWQGTTDQRDRWRNRRVERDADMQAAVEREIAVRALMPQPLTSEQIATREERTRNYYAGKPW